MSDIAIIPQPKGASGYVELARTRETKGRLFEKHILNFGDLIYPKAPGGKVTIDQQFADTLLTNFNNGVCDIVQVPKAGPRNEHTEDPDRNIGEVVGLTVRDKKVYAQIDARSDDDAERLGKTLIGASAMLSTDYTDTRTGKKVGPTLLHVAVTNRPYVTGLEDYQELVAASANGSEVNEAVILTVPEPSEKEHSMTREELIALAKEEHGIDFEALQEKAEKYDANVALTNRLQTELAETGVLTLSNDSEASADDLVGAVVELGKSNVALTARVEGLEETKKRDDAAVRVDSLIREGRILPKDKEAQVELLLSNSDLFERLVPEKPIVSLSQEDMDELGAEISLSAGGSDATVQSEIDRIASSAAAAPYVREPSAA